MTDRAGHHAEDSHVAHEASDVNIRGIMTFAAGLLAFGAVVYVVVWLLFGYFDRRESRSSASLAFPLATGQDDRRPPQPRLQANPREDMEKMREAEDSLLKSYRWVDRNSGVVRIPIEDAIRLTLERGLPSRPPADSQAVK